MSQLLESFLPFSQSDGELDEVFATPFKSIEDLKATEAAPAINVWEEGNDAVLEAEVPGITIENINVHVSGNDVTLSGQRKADEAKGQTCLRSERSTGEFSRTLTLPWEIDADKVIAKLLDGVLTVRLPKSEKSQPKKINISVA